MDATEIKTRHGLILQAVVGLALTSVGLKFRENWQYHPENERPDFILPDNDKPEFMLEVHQTDVRNSFQMKVLRSFNAVCEAKCFFGGNLISVNVLFGDPSTEVPESNLKALCGFFDVNIIPRSSACAEQSTRLERDSLSLAEDDAYDVSDAVAILKKSRSKDIIVFGNLLKSSLATATVSNKLTSLWARERTRIKALSTPPKAFSPTHFKKALLQSLYLSDAHFGELFKKKDPNKISVDAKKQLLTVGLIEATPSILEEKLGPQYRLNSILHAFISNSEAKELRKYCEARLDTVPSMKDFFDDIRDPARRVNFSTEFLNVAKKGKKALSGSILESLISGITCGIEHERCWIADLMPLVVGESHNAFNRRMFQHPKYTQTLGNPFNNIAIRSDRLGSDRTVLKEYADVAVECFFESLLEKGIDLKDVSQIDLADTLALFRVNAAIKLQKLNPLYLEIESVCQELGISYTYGGCPSLLSDLSNPSDPVGKYDLYKLSKAGKEVLLNALYVGEGYGSDHKADEWSARRRSLGYRRSASIISPVSRAGYVTVLDGVWAEKSIKKLHAAGWTHICQPDQLKEALKDCFGIS